MAYKITRDYLHEGSERKYSLVGKGRFKKRDEEGNIIKTLANSEMPHHFRCKDDDGQIYFGGISNDSSSFAPMDDYQGDYGVTTIEYKNPTTKAWEML